MHANVAPKPGLPRKRLPGFLLTLAPAEQLQVFSLNLARFIDNPASRLLLCPADARFQNGQSRGNARPLGLMP